ncbi:putative basic amino acid antiporter YfcC [Salinimonas sp. HHU 13199]|uniref:Basic amino acid antiporter YfcC n=1 Tax=Salinimonas profundi TaxID=2729140 RepID=A0ABR8LG63_9ALTE|nr:putative basic amino acid antiporter YfcC [Salinimonas profundi]MBD3584295.1 putative basic amino acid antiporter YfcC [Salinimonas profundi]
MSSQTRSYSFPSAAVILLSVAVLAYLSAFLVTPGYFESDAPAQSVALNQFTYAPDTSGSTLFAEQGGIGLMNVLFEGMVAGDKYGATIGVAAFILITGGAFGVLMHTGAINRGILTLISHTRRFEVLLLPLLFVCFSLGGAIFGMGEEAIAFCIVLLPVMKQLGYNAQVTVLVTYVATQIGFATSWMNPFSIAIAQSIADIPVFSGAGLRIIAWFSFTFLGLVFLLRYAKRHRQAPDTAITTSKEALTHADRLILISFGAVIGWIIWGVMARQYYIPELAAQFFTLGVVVAIIAKFGQNISFSLSADKFTQGAQELVPAALLVALAKGIVLLLGGNQLNEPSVLNTVLFHCASLLSLTPDIVTAWGMLAFQSLFNFFVASGSGQAAITMPIMAPLGDLLNISRQTVVLAFQLGDGLTNIIIPTSASLIGCLGVVKLDWSQWAATIWRFQLCLFALASAFVIGAHLLHYS